MRGIEDYSKMKDILSRPEYKDIAHYPGLLIVGMGGSYAYGTNTETSDIDVRGVYMNPRDEIFGITPDSEQFVSTVTDTTLYSLRKFFHLLTSCNPNLIELMGLRAEDYLVVTPEGRLILDNKEIFLSKRAIKTFGAYALAQMNRLINRSGRAKSEIVSNEKRSLDKTFMSFSDRYGTYGDIEARVCEDDILLTLNYRDMPISKVSAVLNEINTVHKDYTKSQRNDKAMSHGKITKHMMHLLRLYIMGVDIVNGRIITNREKEHDLLMSIRNGDYMEADGITPNKEFGELLDKYKCEFEYAAANTSLPDEPDYKAINDLMEKVIRMYYNL